MNSVAHRSPIVEDIIFNLIRTIRLENLKFPKKERIDSEVIPKLSDKILVRQGFEESSQEPPKKIYLTPILIKRKSFPQKVNAPIKLLAEGNKSEGIKSVNEIPGREGFQESILENEIPNRPKMNLLQTRQSPPIQKKQPPKIIPINLLINPPNYGKMNPLIRDRLVDFIECPGPEIPILVTTQGRKQQTKITLTKEEIQMFLESASAKTNIPIVAGVFRVSWDNLILNAVISEGANSRFVLKKTS